MSHVYNDSNAYDGQCLRPHITRIRRTQTPPRTSYSEPKFSKSPNYPVSYNCQLVRQQSHLLQIQNPFIEEENFSIHSRTTMKTPIISRLSVASDEVSVPVGPTWNTHKGIDYSDLDSAEEFTIAKRHYTCDGNPVNRKWKKITENKYEDEYEDEYRYPVHFQALPFHGIEAEKSQSCTKNLNQKLYSFPSYPSIQSQSSSYGTFLANDRPSFSNDFISLPHDSQQATGGYILIFLNL